MKGFLRQAPAKSATVTFKAGGQVVRDDGWGALVGDVDQKSRNVINCDSGEYAFEFKGTPEKPVTAMYRSKRTGDWVEGEVIVPADAPQGVAGEIARTESNRLPEGGE